MGYLRRVLVEDYKDLLSQKSIDIAESFKQFMDNDWDFSNPYFRGMNTRNLPYGVLKTHEKRFALSTVPFVHFMIEKIRMHNSNGWDKSPSRVKNALFLTKNIHLAGAYGKECCVFLKKDVHKPWTTNHDAWDEYFDKTKRSIAEIIELMTAMDMYVTIEPYFDYLPFIKSIVHTKGLLNLRNNDNYNESAVNEALNSFSSWEDLLEQLKYLEKLSISKKSVKPIHKAFSRVIYNIKDYFSDYKPVDSLGDKFNTATGELVFNVTEYLFVDTNVFVMINKYYDNYFSNLIGEKEWKTTFYELYIIS